MRINPKLDQSGFIGMAVFVLLVAAAAFVGWRTWEASQISFETGVASEIAAASTLTAPNGLTPKGYVPYVSKDLPISLSIPKNWVVSEGETTKRDDKAKIVFASPENDISFSLTASKRRFENIKDYINAAENSEVSVRIDDVYFKTIASDIDGARLKTTDDRRKYTSTYFLYKDFEFKIDIAEPIYSSNSVARNIYSKVINSISTRSIE